MNESTTYLDKIFKSIKRNAKTLQGYDKVIQGFLNPLQKFYLFLFERKNGKSWKA